MKKSFFVLIISAILCVFAAIAGACAIDQPSSSKDTYIVWFNDNYSGTYAKAEAGEDGKVTFPESPVRDGYEFKGWYLDEEQENEFNESSVIGKNTTVYAKWERKEGFYLVTLKYMNYRTQDEVVSVRKGETLNATVPKYDENEMYSFVGWFIDPACKTPFDTATAVSSDMELYAGWEQVKAYVKFDNNYASAGQSEVKIINIGAAIEFPQDPVREQYEFGGWYTERVGGLRVENGTVAEANTTVYAHWSRSEYSVSFNANGAKVETGLTGKYVVKRGASAEELAKTFEAGMTYEGHDFAGWYVVRPESDEVLPSDKYKADLSAIEDDVTVYAAWRLKKYTVGFDYNYEGAPVAPVAQEVLHGKFIEEVKTIEREGWLFGGWYTDRDCETQFTFDLPVTENLTLYAKWIENTEIHDKIKITYKYKIGNGFTDYVTKEIEFNATASTAAPEDPVVKDYLFGGWYEDQAFTKPFSLLKNLIEDTTVYGKMLKKFTFEAEAINLEGKTGQGTSTNSKEEGMLMDSSFVEGGNVSNGYFIRELYYNGASVDFEIESSETVTDAVIYLRVSSESYKFASTREKDGKEYNYLSEEEFKIIVNGEWDGDTPMSWLSYGGLYMPMANLIDKEDLSQHKTPFEDMFIAMNVTLNQGTNYITLLVANNNNHGGTFHAEAPIIDCMYIYTSAELSMYDYEYYTRPGVNRG